MQLTVKMITKLHPRGCTVTLDMPEGTTVGEMMDYLLQTEELRPYGPDLFFAHVCVRNGLVVPRATVLAEGDAANRDDIIFLVCCCFNAGSSFVRLR